MAAPEHQRERDRERVRVLVIDDSAASRGHIVGVLERLPGVGVTAAASGSQGLRAIRDGGASLVLCDYEMPDLSGLQVLRFARQAHTALDLPVLILTSRDDADIRVKAFRAGANDYISKQAPPEELLARVGTQIELLKLSRAITEARASKSEQQKFEVIGLLAEGLAHELNTPAQYIHDSLGFLSENVPALTGALAQVRGLPGADSRSVDEVLERADYAYLVEELPRAIRSAQEGIEQVARVVSVLREFVRPGADQPSRNSLNEIVRGAIAVTRGQWHQVAELEVQLYEPMPVIECAAVALKQVILFALMNAVRSLTPRPELAERGRLRVCTELEPSGWAVIEVRDNGHGISREQIDAVMNPVLGQRARIDGAQGLAHAQLVVVQQHQGRLEIESSASGTRLRIALPVNP